MFVVQIIMFGRQTWSSQPKFAAQVAEISVFAGSGSQSQGFCCRFTASTSPWQVSKVIGCSGLMLIISTFGTLVQPLLLQHGRDLSFIFIRFHKFQ